MTEPKRKKLLSSSVVRSLGNREEQSVEQTNLRWPSHPPYWLYSSVSSSHSYIPIYLLSLALIQALSRHPTKLNRPCHLPLRSPYLRADRPWYQPDGELILCLAFCQTLLVSEALLTKAGVKHRTKVWDCGELVKRYPMHSTSTSTSPPHKMLYADADLPTANSKVDPQTRATLQIGMTILLIAAVVCLL